MTSTTQGSTTTAYAYDGLGKRLLATTGSQETKYKWDPNAALPLLVRESNGSGGLIRQYVYGADLISQQTNSASRFYHHDGLGSVVALTSGTGAVDARYAYELYGSSRTAAGLPPVPGSPPAPANPMRFTGEYLDALSNLYHLRARDYDSAVQRFLQVDPAPSTLRAPNTPYSYVDNRPTYLVDPSGQRGCGNIPRESLVPYLYGVFSLPSCLDYTPVLVNTPYGLRYHRPRGGYLLQVSRRRTFLGLSNPVPDT
jgi:RHS repeat-associated protein